MAEKVIMPKQGLQMTEGTITGWYAEEGDTVTEGQPLFEIETDKLTITIDANYSGTLLKILRREGDVVSVAETIAIIGEPGEDYGDLLKDIENSEVSSETSESKLTEEVAAKQETNGASSKKVLSTPRAKLKAEELGVDLAVVSGTGPEGLVTEKDVLAYAQAEQETVKQEESCPPDVSQHAFQVQSELKGSDGREKIIPLTTMRKIVAQRMHESLHTMAQATHRITVDMTQAVELRGQLKEQKVKVSYNDIIIRCVAKALTEYPMLNASFTDSAIVEKNYVNIGLAVALPGGLVVPVIKDANLKTLLEIAADSVELIQKAKEGKLQEEDCTGGTFTVTNLGMYDIDSFTAIINPPEVGILAVGKISKRVVVGKEDNLEIKPIMELTLTYDHRAVDGAPAAEFLRRIKELLEYPGLLI
ncbi:MAG TPA: 2-oxo acid dehydrogenase subunit E2 [Clostridia bacterium]|nr:2-oxo acid dehydrogenase subunit E2 [Clostridia bacterium]